MFVVFQKHYVSSPALITRATVQNKILLLVDQLMKNKINSKKKLLAHWKTDPKFLLSPMSLWVDRTFQKSLTEMWPPVGEAPGLPKSSIPVKQVEVLDNELDLISESSSDDEEGKRDPFEPNQDRGDWEREKERRENEGK